MLSKTIIILSALVLSACATAPQPAVKTVIQRVEIPIAVPCNAVVPAQPAFGFGSLLESQPLFDKVQILLMDRELHLGYEVLLLGALNSCIK